MTSSREVFILTDVNLWISTVVTEDFMNVVMGSGMPWGKKQTRNNEDLVFY
jgi:hypothetical protein